MKLLIVTQRVHRSDENLGAFYYWFIGLATRFEEVVIIADAAGESAHLPANITVVTLGKEEGIGRMRRLWRFWELFSYYYARTDAVFFHMIPEFVLAAAPFLVSLRRPSFLWYAHGAVSRRLAWAERLVDFVLTSSAGGFRLPSKKVLYLGQAVNTDLFRLRGQSAEASGRPLRMISIGRIAPVKDYETIIRACKLLDAAWDGEWRLTIVGGPILPRDHEYFSRLKHLVMGAGLERKIIFAGPRGYEEIPSLLAEHDLFLNASRTGSLDKAVLEAMATGLTVITANDAYRTVVPAEYFLEHRNAEFLATRIKKLALEPRPNRALRDIVLAHHSLAHTVEILGTLIETEVRKCRA
ncbi:MAG: glycosyltransferase family 4 protein [bacterium]|nr:glycosyltransferase family 4 protein [bacterium]MDZ4299854.1 glycosyltransferase family 4 protein [Candidatus Sungbacteria bacterium]